MKTTRWLGVLVMAMWCLSGGAAVADDKPAKAKVEGKIIEYRDAHGPFKKAQDLEKVDGVGKGVIEKNAGRIVVK